MAPPPSLSHRRRAPLDKSLNNALQNRRERGQATLDPPAKGGGLAEAHARAMCLGGQPQERKLFAGAVPTPAAPARTQEGDLCRRCLDPDRRIPYAARR